jgi:membrane fusion protein (multidrug efflux system)
MKTKFLFLLIAFIITGCGNSDKEKKADKQDRSLYVSLAESELMTFNNTESAVGSIEGTIDPTVSSEVSGKVIKIHAKSGSIVKKGDLLAEVDNRDNSYQLNLAKADVKKLEARLNNQKINYDRNLKLVDQNFISPNALESIEVAIKETEEELSSAKARLDIANLNYSRTKIFAPINGVVEKQIISMGDFVKIGDPMYQIISNQKLRAHIPFPERLANQIKPGAKIILSTPTSPEIFETKVSSIKPLIVADSRSLDVIADIQNKPGWQAGASVIGTIVFSSTKSVGVPEQSVVLRPIGSVVYLYQNGKAKQNLIQKGITQDGKIQILEGLEAGEKIIVDGAGYLSDQAQVKIK